MINDEFRELVLRAVNPSSRNSASALPCGGLKFFWCKSRLPFTVSAGQPGTTVSHQRIDRLPATLTRPSEMNTPSGPTPDPVSSNRILGFTFLFLAIAVALAVLFQVPGRVEFMLQAALDSIKQLGLWAPVFFILLYVASCIALIPGSVLTMGGGAVFGVLKGSLYVSVGATLGATAAFLVGRYLARDWVTRRFGSHPAFTAVNKAVAAEGWRIVFLTRLCPIFPFFLMNYAYALTRVSLRDFVLATWIGIIPGSTLFVYIGSLAHAGTQPTTVEGWIGKGFILTTVIITTIYITRLARKALARRGGMVEAKASPEDRNGSVRSQ